MTISPVVVHALRACLPEPQTPTREDLLDALRAFCGDHEATGFQCAGLNAAYIHAKALIRQADGR